MSGHVGAPAANASIAVSADQPAGERHTIADVLLHQRSKRALVLLLMIGAIALLVASHALHARLDSLTTSAAAFVEQHSVSGAAVFLLLSILSAMLAFFSTAALLPVAVAAWGKLTSLLLLWSGWFLGGLLSYLIGRYLGHGAVARLMPDKKLQEYERQLRVIAGFPQVLLLQLALPSEVPGYVLGTLRFRFGIYAAALAIAELPYAFGAVYLSDSFLRGNLSLLIALGVGGVALSWFAASVLHRRLHR